jgi:opacity protein-like surface antigen
MNMVKRLVLATAAAALFVAFATPASAQSEVEIGVLGLVSDYNELTASNASNSGDVGPGLGYGGGFLIGQTINERWGGEFRYIYSRNDLELKAGSFEADLGHQSHAVHYDLLYYFSDSDARVRPYVAGGIGVKYYQGVGAEDPFQPGMDLVLLTKATQTMLVGDVGLGVKFRVGSSGVFRIEFRDYITGVPENVITASPGASIDGDLLHQFAPMIGYSWTF